MEKEINTNQKIETEILSKKSSPFIIPFFIGIVLLFFGISIYLVDKFTFDTQLTIESFFPSILLEIIGLGILFFIYSKEFKTSKNYTLNRLKIFLSFTGAILIIVSLISFTLTFRYSRVLAAFSIYNEIFLVLSGVILVLIIYLAPRKRVFTIDELNILEEGSNVKSDNEKKLNSESVSKECAENETFEDYLNKYKNSSDKIDYHFFALTSRIKEQKYEINKQATVNLIIGVTIAIGGVLALIVIVQLNSKIPSEDILAKFNYFSRLSLVVFIEILAIFFLKLYKENLNDKKFYQNELTNIESKHIALLNAQVSENKKDISKVIDKLSNTERNFILKKDESTVNLRQIELENSFLEQILSKMNVLNKNIQSKK